MYLQTRSEPFSVTSCEGMVKLIIWKRSHKDDGDNLDLRDEDVTGRLSASNSRYCDYWSIEPSPNWFFQTFTSFKNYSTPKIFQQQFQFNTVTHTDRLFHWFFNKCRPVCLLEYQIPKLVSPIFFYGSWYLQQDSFNCVSKQELSQWWYF